MHPAIVWFRQDLRLSDQRALTAAIASGQPIIPLYTLDDHSPGPWKMGGASRWWLHHSLLSLAKDLEKLGSRLILRSGNTTQVLEAIATQTGASSIFTPSWCLGSGSCRNAAIAASSRTSPFRKY